MGYIPEQHVILLVVIFPLTKISFSNQQVQILVTILNNSSYNYHDNHSSILRQWHYWWILHFINTILYLFITTFRKFTMVDLLISQLRSILNGMITKNCVINSNNVLFQMLTVLIIFVFGDRNDCKNNGNIIVGINIPTESRHLHNIKSVSIGLVFCLIITFGNAVDPDICGTGKEYANDNNLIK